MIDLDISTLDNGVRLVKLSGKMDIQGVNQIGEEFALKISSTGIPTIVDLREVSFIASLGMRILLSAARGVANHDAKMVLLKPQPLVKEALTVAGLNSLIPSYDDLYLAMAALDPINA
ncbi:anti-anti-sigma factor [[Leptolyngbya] sp. PCC 7376]|uniref:STAS domain-containing protein n=1 Tax=[Leptolyngbya] sp. PCC 7376 TaxID=111781 RepID=UPI00029F2008|nr:STAS domain-containing protein [[Leptolyngbya] sp. PCC 7376]AFY37029.1 anti-anti-sigma factor [[Leptolyngbya] sp. PCC 7376]